jgi:hypothetical protein
VIDRHNLIESGGAMAGMIMIDAKNQRIPGCRESFGVECPASVTPADDQK